MVGRRRPQADRGDQPPVAVVCGGSSGIGRASAEGLSALGYRVAILGRDQRRLENAVAGLRRTGHADVQGWPVDVTDSSAVEHVFGIVDDVYGTLNALVNAVGPTDVGRFEDLSDGDWMRTFDQGTLSAVRTIRAALPIMRRSGWGRIVNITATSLQHQSPVLVAYTASKAALASLTKNLARTLAPDGILVNAVAPGSVRTESIAAVVRSFGGDPDDFTDVYRVMAERFGAHIDLGRVGSPEEVAEVVVFCASASNTFMTGAHINVDGGSDFV